MPEIAPGPQIVREKIFIVVQLTLFITKYSKAVTRTHTKTANKTLRREPLIK